MTTDREALIKRLRKLADAIAKAGINGFGNECAFIADELEALSAQGGEQTDTVSVPREHLILWRRVMLQNPGDFEDKCAEEMSAALAAAKEGK